MTLSEEDGVRYLHFGTPWVQGAMRITRPWQLELSYQQQMMGCALFISRPERVLQLGLGAAALTKFCYRNLPSARITVVELNSHVIDTAHRSFALPPDDERLEVVQADAREYLGDRRRAGRADWLQVDLYDAAARGPVFDDAEFYELCRRVLRRPGVACFNLFGSRFDPSFRTISDAFDDRVLALPAVDEGNHVVFGLTGPRLDEPMAAVERHARALEAAWRLPLVRWSHELREANGLGDRLKI